MNFSPGPTKKTSFPRRICDPKRPPERKARLRLKAADRKVRVRPGPIPGPLRGRGRRVQNQAKLTKIHQKPRTTTWSQSLPQGLEVLPDPVLDPDRALLQRRRIMTLISKFSSSLFFFIQTQNKVFIDQ